MGVYKVESCVCVVFDLVQFVSNSFIGGFESNWVVGYWLGVRVSWEIDGKVIMSNRIIGKICSCLLSCGGDIIQPCTPLRLKRTLSDKRRMSFNVAMHYPVITVYYAAISKH